MRSFLLAILTLCSLSAVEDNPTRDNVVIVLDGSGSMEKVMRDKNQRMEAAKKAITTVIDATDANTAIGLVAFSGSQVKRFAELHTGDHSAMRQAVLSLPPSGKTPLGEALRVAGDMLLEARKRQYGYGTFTMLVVTDGEASDKDLMNRYGPEIVARGIRMDVIGVDMAQAHTLRRIAHRYSSAADAESLGAAVASTFAEIGGGSGDAAGEDFDLINGAFSDESASAVLTVLATNDNRPIGSQRVAMPEPVNNGGAAPAVPKPAQGPQAAAGTNPVPDQAPDGGVPFSLIIIGVVVLIIFGRVMSRR